MGILGHNKCSGKTARNGGIGICVGAGSDLDTGYHDGDSRNEFAAGAGRLG
jgi:hypothetical protein